MQALADGDDPASVVPRKGDVDRNKLRLDSVQDHGQSSPARGTWIEMSVIRAANIVRPSSPARGTWIEILDGRVHPARV